MLLDPTNDLGSDIILGSIFTDGGRSILTDGGHSLFTDTGSLFIEEDEIRPPYREGGSAL